METTIKGQFVVDNYDLRSVSDSEKQLFDMLKAQFALGTIIEVAISVKNTGKTLPRCTAKTKWSDKCGQLLSVEGACSNAREHVIDEQ